MNEYRELWWPTPTVDLGQVVEIVPEGGFETVHGATLERLQFSYESWGSLSAERDNAVLIVHPLASDPHPSGEFAEQPRGWWEPLIGPGRPIDTDRHFVVCPNLLGGCYGSTGPRFPAPDGEPWLDRFPLLTPLDLMRAQRLFLAALDIERLNLVVGPSMGGMVAWEWAIEAGKQVDHAVVVAAPLNTTPLQIGWNWLQRRGIELDLKDDAVAARWGQMIARGVGMLSYRSPEGLEQRFGRDWFKLPGSSLGDRGVFNIESWLRHHGKKAVKRYDPYTYLLFSRAMDLHDVGIGRGGVVAALDRVRCPVTVVGISSDQLYPASQVRAGVEILEHLGRPVDWQLISSPHGHDAFLLETDQLGAILRGLTSGRSTAIAAPMASDVRTVRLGILGAGKVAATLLRLLDERHAEMVERFRLRLDLVGVAEIDRDKRLDPIFDRTSVTYEPDKLAQREDVELLVDLTRGSGSYATVEHALRRGCSVATPNKSLVRAHGPELERLAFDHGARLAYHNSIAAGWPLLYSIERPLGRSHVEGFRAILSSTCNAILGSIERGESFDAALDEARSAGFPEPDPDLDTSGWDTAQKLLILVARACSRRFAIEDVPVTGILDVDPEIVRAAPGLGLRVKLVGLFLNRIPQPVIGVLPVAVEATSYLGGLHGGNSAVVLEDREGGEMVFVGSGVSDVPVASAVLNDVVGLVDPNRSWTGRYPRAVHRPHAPRFASFVLRDPSGKVIVGDAETPGAIPVLSSWVYPRD